MKTRIYALFLTIYAFAEFFLKVTKKSRVSRRKTSDKKDFFFTIPLSLLLIYPFDKRNAVKEPSRTSFFAATVILISAVVIRIKSLLDLGDQFSFNVELRENHRVVTDGFYGFIRHPLYLALLLMMAAALIFKFSRMALFLFLSAFLGIGYRIFNEERFLKKNLPGYKAYCRKTKLILPFIL